MEEMFWWYECVPACLHIQLLVYRKHSSVEEERIVSMGAAKR